jgi:hypothetical protein
MIKRIENAFDLHSNISDDTAICADKMRSEPRSQFWRRTTVRTFGAAIETETHMLAEIVRAFSDIVPLTLSADQRKCLESERAFSALKRVTLTWQVVGSLVGRIGRTKIPGDITASLERVITIRNRITHPKMGDDLNVTDEETIFYAETIYRYNNVVISLLGDLQFYFVAKQDFDDVLRQFRVKDPLWVSKDKSL